MVEEPSTLRLAVLLSGSGTTLQNLLDRIADGRLAARVVLVVSSSRRAFGLDRAKAAGISTAVIERKNFATDQQFSEAIFGECRQVAAQLVCLAGFLKFLPIPTDFYDRVLNIHPSLIPAFCGHGFYGHHVHEAVLESGVKITGCTVHFADNEYDHGPIVLQRAVPVLSDDTPESVAARVFEQECEAFPEAIQLFAEKRLRISGRRVHILSGSSHPTTSP
jgi:phosphoribosylglycinamide formyltransferase-1